MFRGILIAIVLLVLLFLLIDWVRDSDAFLLGVRSPIDIIDGVVSGIRGVGEGMRSLFEGLFRFK